jgi:signal transduction histidine kinase
VLQFDDAADIPVMRTDEGRLSQILRNFLSNAIKYTERGEIRVQCCVADDDRARFSVADSGIGISPDDQGRIFEDYGQIDGPIQRRVRGTGLGLPLTRKLAALLGGTVSVTSAVGGGSTFTVIIPRDYERARGAGDDCAAADGGHAAASPTSSAGGRSAHSSQLSS